jgi:CubicO group peptidase (beta-lactamase class C family)
MSSNKVISTLLFFSIVFSACHSDSIKSQPLPIDSTEHAPPMGSIAPEMLHRYHDAIQSYYEKYLVGRGFNGAILVAKNGQVIFEDYHGYYNLQKKDSLTQHSAFHLASVSKTFTAMATLKLAEMGKLSVEDDVRKFFPSFPYDNITVKSLLTHRSGLPNYLYFMDKLGWDRKTYCTNEDILDYMIRFKPAIMALPDKHFTYCNTNYALLGLIIEKASGQPYAEFLKQQIFTPLKMNDTYVFSHSDSATAMPSYDYRGRQERLTDLDLVYGDKNIYSTPEDLLKWDQALYSNQIFKSETLQAAFTPYSNEKPGIRNYGFGWRMNVYPDGKKVIYHNGWWHGSNTVFIRMIQDSATIIVLGNKYNRNIYESKKMAEIFDPSFMILEDEKQPVLKDETLPAAEPVIRVSKRHHVAKKQAVKKAPVKKTVLKKAAAKPVHKHKRK